ncbi:hypothetical protein GCM10010435_90820 [Winogradskya consettensis]|uniref:Lipoprotein n=1 Tax=Winogradskya consettensis TaxID=113560 RepID=A0A919SIY2_9ACTN|nr:hypothetical protein [Actinoplanes consettensis]GIM73267.1 hypothetical protein Aco04nite_34390 [Actinoplanes consettensis]
MRTIHAGVAATASLAASMVLAAGCAAPGTSPTWEAGAPSASSVAPSPTTKAPKPKIDTENGAKGPLGDVIDLGGLEDADGNPYVIFGVTGRIVNETSAFGFAIGVRLPKNVVREDLTISEYEGKATDPGFHPMQAQMDLLDKSVQPAFGYYSGTPARITVREVNRTIEAHLATWSEDPHQTVFWFDPADVHDSSQWTDLGAYDAAGTRLPDGHIELSTF